MHEELQRGLVVVVVVVVVDDVRVLVLVVVDELLVDVVRVVVLVDELLVEVLLVLLVIVEILTEVPVLIESTAGVAVITVVGCELIFARSENEECQIEIRYPFKTFSILSLSRYDYWKKHYLTARTIAVFTKPIVSLNYEKAQVLFLLGSAIVYLRWN